jgi:hypothetical protein
MGKQINKRNNAKNRGLERQAADRLYVEMTEDIDSCSCDRTGNSRCTGHLFSNSLVVDKAYLECCGKHGHMTFEFTLNVHTTYMTANEVNGFIDNFFKGRCICTILNLAFQLANLK